MSCRSRLAPVLKRAIIPSLKRSGIAANPSICAARCISSTAQRRFRKSSARHVKYTTDSYPEIKRDSRFAQITKEHVDYFKQLLGKESALVDGVTAGATEDDLEAFNSDWMSTLR